METSELRKLVFGSKLRTTPFEHPSLPADQRFTIRCLSSRERGEVVAMCVASAKQTDPLLREKMCAFFLGDETGRRIFENEHIGAVGDLEGVLVEAVCARGAEFNELLKAST